MKSGKILLAILIFISFMREGLNAFKETGDAWFVIIMLTVALLLSGLLIRSAFKPKDRFVQENKNKIYLWNFIKVVSILGIIGFVLNSGQNKTIEHVADYNGLKIPLDKCIRGNVRMIESEEERINYCDCMAGILASDETVLTDYKDLLLNGDFGEIINSMKSRGLGGTMGLEGCFGFVTNIEWTDNVKIAIKGGFRNEMRGTDLEERLDIEGYCDCIVDSLVNYPANEIISGEFYETKQWVKIDSICTARNLIGDL